MFPLFQCMFPDLPLFEADHQGRWRNSVSWEQPDMASYKNDSLNCWLPSSRQEIFHELSAMTFAMDNAIIILLTLACRRPVYIRNAA